MENFEKQYKFIEQVLCINDIKAYQENILTATEHLYNFVAALNVSKSDADPVVQENFDLLERECRGNKCYKSVRYLLSFINSDNRFKV